MKSCASPGYLRAQRDRSEGLPGANGCRVGMQGCCIRTTHPAAIDGRHVIPIAGAQRDLASVVKLDIKDFVDSELSCVGVKRTAAIIWSADPAPVHRRQKGTGQGPQRKLAMLLVEPNPVKLFPGIGASAI